MAKKNIFHGKKSDEIRTLIAEEQKKLLDMEFSFAGSRSKNVHEKKVVRKNIARGKTILAQMQKTS